MGPDSLAAESAACPLEVTGVSRRPVDLGDSA